MKAKVNLVNGKAYLFTAEDAIWLRKEHRIVGTPVGCYPALPKQNNQLSLPVLLIPEEVTLLLEFDLAELSTVTNPLPKPTQGEVTAYQKYKEETYTQQLTISQQKRKADLERLHETIEAGRRAKKRQRRQEEEKGMTTQEPFKETDTESCEWCAEPKSLSHNPAHVSTLRVEENPKSVTSSCEDPPQVQQSPIICISNEPCRDIVRPAPEWTYPTTPKEVLHYQVFKDLWTKGYFLTKAVKFGGDYLVYPGDPARYHSFYIAKCMEKDEKLTFRDMACLGRLGTTVKKIILLCGLTSDNKINYKSLKWTHMS